MDVTKVRECVQGTAMDVNETRERVPATAVDVVEVRDRVGDSLPFLDAKTADDLQLVQSA